MYVCMYVSLSFQTVKFTIKRTLKSKIQSKDQKTHQNYNSARHANKLSTLIPFEPTFPLTHPIQRNNAQHTNIQQLHNKDEIHTMPMGTR